MALEGRLRAFAGSILKLSLQSQSATTAACVTAHFVAAGQQRSQAARCGSCGKPEHLAW